MMAQKGQEQAAIEQKDAYDLYDDQIRSENRFYEVFSNVEGVGLIAGAYIELSSLIRRRSRLDRWTSDCRI